jgi:hypothetical protein
MCDCGVCQMLQECRPVEQIADRPMLERLAKFTQPVDTGMRAADRILEHIWCDWPTNA